jgi:hypothetical protein
LVAIDGSKFKAVNNRDKNFTDAKMKRRMAQVNESIERYLRAMDSADRAEPEVAELKKGRLQEKIDTLKQQMEKLKDIDAQMRASPDKQVSLTDPDARSMKNREGGIVGYNVQAGGCRASPDRRARGHQRRSGSRSAFEHGRES